MQYQESLISTERTSNSHIEKEKEERIRGEIRRSLFEDKLIQPTFWQTVLDCEEKFNSNIQKRPHSKEDIKVVVNEILKKYEGSVFCPFDLVKYVQMVDIAYKGDNVEMLKDTYVCSFYANDSTYNNMVSLAVKHVDIPGVDFLMNVKIPRLKHFSPNSMPISQKHIKKITALRLFNISQSVFKNSVVEDDATRL